MPLRGGHGCERSVEHLSAHGFLFVVAQLIVVAALAAVLVRHHRRLPAAASAVRRHAVPVAIMVAFALWSVFLRLQPERRGADPFSYTLGVFDGVSLAGILLLGALHGFLVRAAARGAAWGQGQTL
jgi:hypothetical protein